MFAMFLSSALSALALCKLFASLESDVPVPASVSVLSHSTFTQCCSDIIQIYT